MSFSNPTAKNPAVRFMQWRGGEDGGGRVTWYDKEAQEENEVPLPFSFIVLDELTTLTGFSDAQQSGFWSNEVRNSNGILVARTKQGIQARGTYQQIKEQGIQGLKFAQSVYVAFKDESGELQIGNIKIAGAALTAWIEFKKRFDIEQCAVYITDEPKAAPSKEVKAKDVEIEDLDAKAKDEKPMAGDKDEAPNPPKATAPKAGKLKDVEF